MPDGIRINDAAIEISPAGLEAMMNRRGAEVRVTRLDVTVSPEALATLLSRLAPEGSTPPTAEIASGRLLVTSQAEGQRTVIDLHAGDFRLQITPDGLRLVGGNESPGTR